MAFRTEEKQIGDHTFQVNTLSYGLSKKVSLRAKQLFMILVAEDGSFEQDSPLSAAVFMDLDESDLDFVVDTLATYSKVKTTGDWQELSKQKEVVFAGDLGLMFSWLSFALEVNYGSFLQGLRNAAAKNLAESQTASKSRKK